MATMENYKMTFKELVDAIDHWNDNRVPILRISKPDNDLNFQGAMRFYFQDAGQKVATKCVSVTSADTTKDVIDVLIEKFRPDMRMLSVPEYGLYEIHESGDERKLDPHERPLIVQLEWNNDDREGRFLLRRMDEKTRDLTTQGEEPSLKRKLSKKEKKRQDKLKKQQQKEKEKADAATMKLAAKNKNGIAERLYNELPETSFTRSISNPEAVMKRRRAQKLERRLQEFSVEGGQEAGGTLRIFGETINKDVSYKTLLLSTKDTAASVVKQILEKYGKENENPCNYCLVQLIVPHSATAGLGENNSVSNLNTSASLRETILDDIDCPLLINQTHDVSRGILTFHIRIRPADWQKRRKKKPIRNQAQQNPFQQSVVQQLNQRLQGNGHIDQYNSNQNSPQHSSQASDSMNMDSNNPLPAFETVRSMPAMYTNGNNITPYHHQQNQQSISSTTLPPRINNLLDVAGANFQRQIQSQQNLISGKQQFAPIGTNGHYPVNQQVTQPYIPPVVANDQILPALIQVKEDVEDIFLEAVISRLRPIETAFRLAPTYVLYMVSRYRASTLFHPELQAPSRAELFVPFTKKIASMIRDVIETNVNDSTHLAFWLANSSDLSHFYKQDKHLSHFTIEAQEILYDSIKTSFKYLLTCKQSQLDDQLNAFFDEIDDGSFQQEASAMGNPSSHISMNRILDVLNETMATMRKNRVNAALTIQIFSHLFHHISKWLFDRLIGVYDRQPAISGQPSFAQFCNRVWGEKLNTRLAMIGGWAERQGLEQAADFHLTRVTQVTMFLAKRYPPHISPQDLKEACDNCDRLNPVQLRSLLLRYDPETPTLRLIIQNLTYTMDYKYMAGDFPLEEDFELKIPFLIPEDGYSSEIIRYIPNGLLDFVSYLSKIRFEGRSLCIFTVQPTSSGFWTVYFKNHQPDTPEIIVIQLRKKDNSMGLSIIAARGNGQDRLGIYIKAVVKNGAAAMDGRLQAGDQLLEVDGNSLLDISQEIAAELMQRTGPIVTLRIAKQAAIYHNLSDVINSVPSQTIMSVQPTAQQRMPPTNMNNHTHQTSHVDNMRQQPNQRQQASSQMHPPQPVQPMERHLPMSAPNQLDQRLPTLQFQQDRLLPQLTNERTLQNGNANISTQLERMQLNERQANLQPPPPSMMYNNNINDHDPPPLSSLSLNPTSPLKSPKKVSWLDTQPHQSLHTYIPLPPVIHDDSSPPDAPSPPAQLEKEYLDHQRSHAYLGNGSDHQLMNVMGVMRMNQENGAEDDEDEDDDVSGPQIDRQIQSDHLTQLARDENHNNRHEEYRPHQTSDGNNDDDYQPSPNAKIAVNGTPGNGHPMESLTLEDIDEVLSSKTHNNWIEDSAGVIGTQEVYNDPRQRIVKERQRPNSEVNIEGLTFREKLKMFDTSAKKQ